VDFDLGLLAGKFFAVNRAAKDEPIILGERMKAKGVLNDRRF